MPHGFLPAWTAAPGGGGGRHARRVGSELSTAARAEITRKYAKSYQVAPKALKSQILDQVCQVTGWSRDNVRRRLVARACAPPGARRARPGPKPGARRYSYDALKVLGFDVGDAETGTFWTAFLRSLKARGLAGVLLVSDAHEGLKNARDAGPRPRGPARLHRVPDRPLEEDLVDQPPRRGCCRIPQRVVSVV